MGYKPQNKIYDLEFVDYPGLEIKARSAPLGELSAAYDLNININEKDKEKQLEVFQFFADKLLSWNLEHPEVPERAKTYPACPQCGLLEDAAMPPTVTSMMCLEISMIMAIIMGWINTVAKVSVPKGMTSKGGEMSIPEEVMQKLELLQNPELLPTPN